MEVLAVDNYSSANMVQPYGSYSLSACLQFIYFVLVKNKISIQKVNILNFKTLKKKTDKNRYYPI